MNPDLSELIENAFATAGAIAAGYQFFLGGVPTEAGFEALGFNALDTDFGWQDADGQIDGETAFNPENQFINIFSALAQENEAAQDRFAGLMVEDDLIATITRLYDAIIQGVTAEQREAALDYLTRPEALEYYRAVAAERIGTDTSLGLDGAAAIVALAALSNIAVRENVPGLGASVNNLFQLISEGNSPLPESGESFTNLESIDPGTGGAGNPPPVNDAPTATIDPNAAFAATEGMSVSLTGFVVGDVDAGRSSVTVTLSVDTGVLSVSSGTGVTVANSGTGTVTLDGTVGAINTLLATADAITYTVDDDTPPSEATLTLSINDNGNTGTGGALTNVVAATATIAITAVNDVPVLTLAGNGTSTEQVVGIIDPAAALADAELDAAADTNGDYDGTTLTVSRQGGADPQDVFGVTNGYYVFDNVLYDLEGERIGSVTDAGGSFAITFGGGPTMVTGSTVNVVLRSLTYQNTSDTPPTEVDLTITFSDENGALGVIDQGTEGVKTHSVTTTLTITADNDAPIAVDDTSNVAEEGVVTIDVLANDTDVDGPSQTITAATVDAAQGTVTVENGQLQFTAATNFFGDAVIAYTVSDGELTDEGQAIVAVSNVNDDPVAANGSASTNEDTAITSGTLPTATDVDSDTLTFELVASSASNGVATVNTDGTFTFMPTTDYNGPASFKYVVSDEDGGTSAEYTMDITVTSVNDATTATGLNQTTAFIEDAGPVPLFGTAPVVTDVDADETVTATLTLSNTAAGVLTGAGTDVSGVYTLTGTVAEVNATLAAVTFDSAADFAQDASVTISIADGLENGTVAATGLVTLDGMATNDAPVATTILNTTVNDGDAIFYDIASAFSDPDGDSLTFTAELENGDPLPGWLMLNSSTGRFTGGSPDDAGPTQFSIEVTATDGSGAADSDIFLLGVLDNEPV